MAVRPRYVSMVANSAFNVFLLWAPFWIFSSGRSEYVLFWLLAWKHWETCCHPLHYLHPLLVSSNSFVTLRDLLWVSVYGNTPFICRISSPRPPLNWCVSLSGISASHSQLCHFPAPFLLTNFGQISISEPRSKSRRGSICHVFASLVALQNYWLRASLTASVWILCSYITWELFSMVVL